jgi:hypothetical protein
MRLVLVLLLCLACCDKAKDGGAGPASAGSNGEATEPEADDEGSAVAKTWNAGDVVQVKRDGKWHEAEIVTVGTTYKVLYTFADTIEDNVDATRLRAPKWSKKAHVEAQVGDAWKRGTVVAHHDGSYDIALDDGGTKTFSAAQVRGIRKPKSAPHSSAASSGGGEPAPCPGTSFMKRCGGGCTDTLTDTSNCGRCNSHCQSGDPCDHGVCRDRGGTPYSGH